MKSLSRPTHASDLHALPDAELVSRACRGDPRAYEIIMHRYNRLLFRTARSILKDDSEAEDALQEAYLHAWRALGKFRADAKLSTWLVRIVANEALSRIRRRTPQVIPLEAAIASVEPGTREALTHAADDRPEQVALRTQLRDLVESRIDLLPQPFRTVFILRELEEMSVSEVARALEIPEATVRTRVFRARGLLRTSLMSDIDMTLADVFAFDGARCDHIVQAVLTRIRADERPAHK